MNNLGYVRVAAAVPQMRVADAQYNTQQIIQQIREAADEGVQVITFPELCVVGYTCADLFFLQQLQHNAMQALETICAATQDLPIIVIVGAPLKVDNNLYNCAFVMTDGDIVGVVPKVNLPNTAEFYEKRWFTPGRDCNVDTLDLFCGDVPFGPDLLFITPSFTFGIEMCEDLWSPLPPSTQLAIQGAEIIFNLSSSNCITGKHAFRRQMITQQSARVHCGYVYSSSGVGESTTDVVFSGSTYIAENGDMLCEGERFQRQSSMIIGEIDIERLRTDRQRNTNFTCDHLGQYRKIYATPLEYPQPTLALHRQFDAHPFVPEGKDSELFFSDVFAIQTNGLAKRWEHTHAQSMVIGISGGLDSTLALLVACFTADMLGYDRKKVIGVTMPGFGTSDRTYQNALHLMEQLGITMFEIPIRDAVIQHFQDIGHDISQHDITYENAQARERTQILMDMANKYNGMVVGTGDLSELALGWATYNGDQMSMYGVNAGVPKTLVKAVVNYAADNIFGGEIGVILHDIIDTPVSPELLPADENAGIEGELQTTIAQKTEDKVGPYELHDFFIYYTMRYGFTREKIQYMAEQAFIDVYDSETIEKWLNTFMRRFFQQQYKRSCMPDGPKVTFVSLSPRGDWRMPSDATLI
ncbi:MAG: NAD(+) synthase [Paludibacteraceae bacterium]|nr:NAD(+) synthase [Paludibacteraceae bacterium]